MSIKLDRMLQNLQKIQDMHLLIAQQDLTDTVRQLQAWQTNRLLTTHDDLWNSKRFRPAMEFFANEIYGPKDFSGRDVELTRATPKMVKILPKKGLKLLETALRLNRLSLELDLALAQELDGAVINRDSYFECYRQSGLLVQREEQIKLLEILSLSLPKAVKTPGISTILSLTRKPAKVAGVELLHTFLESGFSSFKKIGDANDFIDSIMVKEREMMNSLFLSNDQSENPLPKVNLDIIRI